MKKLKQLESVDDNLTISTTSSTQSSIPVDLLIDIFSRVPSKSIARFLCLSKSWRSILSGPSYFTELFLTKSLNHPRLLFTVQVNDKLVFFSTPQTRPNLDANSSLVATLYKSYSSQHNITSSLHGLVCCQGKRFDYTKPPVICNPATGEFLTLPVAKTILYFPIFYCGYDPIDKIFKVLCISARQPLVLTLGTEKLLWRTINCKTYYPFASEHISPYGHMICIDGVLYYIGRFVIHIMEHVIVCFDVRSEKFSFTSIDDTMASGSTLINYKGRLGAVRFTDRNQRILCLWLLEDAAAGKNKWSKYIYKLPISWKQEHNPCKSVFQIVGMTRTCDIVLSPHRFSDPFHVFYLNVERKTLSRSIEIQGLQELKSHRPSVFIFQDYVEDLQLMKSLCN